MKAIIYAGVFVSKNCVRGCCLLNKIKPFFSLLAVFCLMVSFCTISSVSKAEDVVDILKLREGNSYDLAPYVRVIESANKDKKLYDAMGEYTSGKGTILSNYKFKYDVSGYWLMFRVKNLDTLRNVWFIDFGRSSKSVMGVSNVVTLFSSDNLERHIMIDGRHVKNKKHLEGQKANAVPVYIPTDQTKTFAVYIEPLKGFPFNISPKMVERSAYAEENSQETMNSGLVTLFMVILTVISFSLYLRWKDPANFMLSIYTMLFLTVYNVSDEIIPYGNNTMAVYLDMIFVAQIIMALFLAQLVLSPIKGEGETATSNMSIIASILGVAVVFVSGLNYDLNEYADLAIFRVLSLAVPGFIILKTLFSSKQDVKSIDSFGFLLTWIILLAGRLLYETGVYEIKLFDLNIHLVSNIAHILMLHVFTLNIVNYKKKIVEKREKQNLLRIETEEELKRTYEMVSRNRILDIMQSEKDLLMDLKKHEHEKLNEAKEVNVEKINFLATVSHEIRTPMTGIMALVNLLSNTHLSDMQREYVETLQKTGNTLLSMLNNILDLSKAESGNMQIETINFNLREVVQNIFDIMEHFAKDKKLEFKLSFDPRVPKIVAGDPTRLSQILTNLINNAIKFTSQGHVRLDVKYTGEKEGKHQILFSVEDSGIGIPEEARDTVFKPYIQGEASVTRRFGGTGLGLSICQHIVNSMGGNIDFKSQENRGTVFFFNVTFDKKIVDQKLNQQSNSPVKQATQEEKKTVNVLVVDDNEANCKLISMVLGKDLGRVVTANSANQAVNAMEKEYFDAVFMDLEMPEFDGIVATGLIRNMKDRRKCKTPIIAMTAHTDNSVISRCIQAGMNDYIGKPIESAKLEKIISNIVEHKKSGVSAAASQASMGSVRNKETGIEELQGTEALSGSGFEIDFAYQTVNEDIFNEIHKKMSPNEFTKIMKDVYNSVDKELISLNNAMKSGDVNAIYTSSHTICGVAANFGLDALSHMARKIQKHAKNHDELEIISKYAQSLEKIYSETKTEIAKR